MENTKESIEHNLIAQLSENSILQEMGGDKHTLRGGVLGGNKGKKSERGAT